MRSADVLIDAMRGRSTTWTRIRVNVEDGPEALRPEQEEPLESDYDPWAKLKAEGIGPPTRKRAPRAPTEG